jgi:hypothetical protein
MTTHLRRMMLPLLASAAIWTAGTSPGSAYSYFWMNIAPAQGPTVVSIWMHTVSAFCHDVSWNGTLLPGRSITLSSASICLVDRAEARGPNGEYASWSSFGRTGGTFYVNLRTGIITYNPFSARRRHARH